MNRQRALIGGGAGLAAIIALLLVLPSLQLLDAPLSAYGSDDDDASLLVNALRAQGFDVSSLLIGPSALENVDTDQADPVYLAVGVDRGYTEAELDTLFDYVERGGTAIVLDDTGASKSLLDRLGVRTLGTVFATQSENGTQSRDEVNPSVVRVDIAGTIVNLWEPVALDTEGAEVTIVGETSQLAAWDADDNDRIDASDPTCTPACTVAIEHRAGTGRLIFVADATFATNAYSQRAGAPQLVEAIAAQQSTGQRAQIIVDESRHVLGPAEVGLTLFRTLHLPATLDILPWGVVGLLAIMGVTARRGRDTEDWADHDDGLDAPWHAPEARDEPLLDPHELQELEEGRP